ncbi:hypothetical protein B7494_g3177 [Chlorociboria aeruginascens]|nr:hypothetical protein B7494_g3177 [Chlorociboria aeruginascens]
MLKFNINTKIRYLSVGSAEASGALDNGNRPPYREPDSDYIQSKVASSTVTSRRDLQPASTSKRQPLYFAVMQRQTSHLVRPKSPRRSQPFRQSSSPSAIQPATSSSSSQASSNPSYPIPIPPEKEANALKLYIRYRYEEGLAQRIAEPATTYLGFNNGSQYLSLPGASTASQTSSRGKTAPSITDSNYEAITDFSSVISFEDNENPSPTKTETKVELRSYDGKKVKQRVRRPLSPRAKAKAALIRYLGSCVICRSRNVSCPLDHHDIGSLERAHQAKSHGHRHEGRHHTSHSSASSSSRHAFGNLSGEQSASGGAQGVSNTLLGIGQNPQLAQTQAHAVLDAAELELSSPSIGHNDPLAEIRMPVFQDYSPPDLSGLLLNLSPYTNYQSGAMFPIGVVLQGRFVCQHLDGRCQQHFNNPDALQTHFETAHFPFTRIDPPHRYQCSNCQHINTYFGNPCYYCGCHGTIQIWIYGNFIPISSYPRYPPQGQGLFGEISNSSQFFSSYAYPNMMPDIGGYTPNPNADNNMNPGGDSFEDGSSYADPDPDLFNNFTYDTPQSGPYNFQTHTFGGSQMTVIPMKVRHWYTKAIQTCNRHRWIAITLAFFITIGFGVETHDWIINKARATIPHAATRLAPSLPMIGFVGGLASFTMLHAPLGLDDASHSIKGAKAAPSTTLRDISLDGGTTQASPEEDRTPSLDIGPSTYATRSRFEKPTPLPLSDRPDPLLILILTLYAQSSLPSSHVAMPFFTITQSFLGAPLQFQPALGSKALEQLIDAYVVGPASKQDKFSEVTLDFFNNATVDINTGSLFRQYDVYAAPSPYLVSFDRSPTQSQTSGFSPSAYASTDSGYGSISLTPPTSSTSKRPAEVSKKTRKPTRKPANKPAEARLPGFSIMTKDGVDVTCCAGRGIKTKEQREHAHLMRIMKACDDCKKKKVRCDPSHRRAHTDMSRTSTSTQDSSPTYSSPTVSNPSFSSKASQSSNAFSNANAIDDFVLFPEATASQWNPADIAMPEFDAQDTDLSYFNFDLSDIDLNNFSDLDSNSLFDFSSYSQFSNPSDWQARSHSHFSYLSDPHVQAPVDPWNLDLQNNPGQPMVAGTGSHPSTSQNSGQANLNWQDVPLNEHSISPQGLPSSDYSWSDSPVNHTRPIPIPFENAASANPGNSYLSTLDSADQILTRHACQLLPSSVLSPMASVVSASTNTCSTNTSSSPEEWSTSLERHPGTLMSGPNLVVSPQEVFTSQRESGTSTERTLTSNRNLRLQVSSTGASNAYPQDGSLQSSYGIISGVKNNVPDAQLGVSPPHTTRRKPVVRTDTIIIANELFKDEQGIYTTTSDRAIAAQSCCATLVATPEPVSARGVVKHTPATDTLLEQLESRSRPGVRASRSSPRDEHMPSSDLVPERPQCQSQEYNSLNSVPDENIHARNEMAASSCSVARSLATQVQDVSTTTLLLTSFFVLSMVALLPYFATVAKLLLCCFIVAQSPTGTIRNLTGSRSLLTSMASLMSISWTGTVSGKSDGVMSVSLLINMNDDCSDRIILSG